MRLPERHLGPDPTEIEALRQEQLELVSALCEGMDGNRPPTYLSALYTRIALLDADLRRN